MITPVLLLLVLQGFKFEVEFPVFDEFSIIGKLHTGTSVYSATCDGDTFTHIMTVDAIEQLRKISITRDSPQKTTLDLLIAETSGRFSEFIEAKVIAPFGTFKINSITSKNGVPKITSTKKIKFVFKKKSYNAEKHITLYPNGKEGFIVTVPSLGPLGIVSAAIWRDSGKYITYSLKDFK